MNVSTPAPQPIPSAPHVLLASRQDAKEDDKSRRDGSGRDGHGRGNPPSPTDIGGASINPDNDPPVYTDPGKK